jgi:hypothetical protein
MSRYYFLVTALPPLSLKTAPEISFKELYDYILMNLTEGDREQFHLLLQPIQLYNIKAFWLSLPFDDRGMMSAKELEESLLVRDLLPVYLIDFLDRYDSPHERLLYFPSLYASMYRQEFKGVLGKYFAFERETRLVLTALRAKKMGRDIVRELQFEDSLDPFVASIIAQKDAADYVPPFEYEGLKVLFVENSSDPSKLSMALLKYRFEKIVEWEENESFTLDRVIAYAARLLIVESFFQLDQEKGRKAVEELSKYG